MFENFPKTRPALPPEHARIYEQHYKENRRGGTVASTWAQRMESWMHRQVAADVAPLRLVRSTLEIGAGNLNQLQYEPTSRPYDIIEPQAFFYEGSPRLERVDHIYEYIEHVPPDRRYDRLISIATFEHICNLPEVVARGALLLSKIGQLRVSIPSEGTWLWTMGYQLSTGVEFRLRYRLNYTTLMQHEHVNTAAEIEAVLRYFFDEVQGKACGLGKANSFYQFFACTRPDLDKCRAYLAEIGVEEQAAAN